MQAKVLLNPTQVLHVTRTKEGKAALTAFLQPLGFLIGFERRNPLPAEAKTIFDNYRMGVYTPDSKAMVVELDDGDHLVNDHGYLVKCTEEQFWHRYSLDPKVLS